MASTDPRVDAYIDKQAAFAQPILRHLRSAVHRTCPDVEETLRWGMPSFTYKGQILCQMAAFKEHAVFGFWRSREVTEAEGGNAMGQFGRLATVADLPDEATLDEMIRKAAALVDSGIKAPRPVKHPKPELAMPGDFAAALTANAAAQASFDGFAPSARRDYLEWVIEAKRPETRAKRIAQAVEWLAEGKKRHWKYEKC
jgi:uncharacterized protein YdeI (YjbR/CyaY-like superfamily)